ncbi:hypothetical protein HD554DRAFT_2247045 [Boletus coccyginus]|nr:hypothetical protein HD554DRAFT_2247045 [Boletus coccyginus]
MNMRLSYIRGIRTLLVIALSWYISISLVYLPAWSFFVAAPFGKSPQLAAVVLTFLAILLAILALVFFNVYSSTIAATIFTLIFPPGYYIFAIHTICGYENHLMPTNLLKPDPDDQLTLLPILIAYTEWYLRGASMMQGSRHVSSHERRWIFFHIPVGWPSLSRIYVISAGKSTSLSIIANLIGQSLGSITFEGGMKHPPRGMLGIVPQNNVLFPNLTCYQTLWVWCAIKYSYLVSKDNDYEPLLCDCDLGNKIHSNVNTLSVGQKWKLRLAIRLVGGSKIVLVDECTSGVDPLSRHALWRTLTSVKHNRTIVFTTHFLDEAGLLADCIAILAAPGKLVAEGPPIALKTSLGQDYSIHVTFDSKNLDDKDPTNLTLESSPTHATYHLKSKNSVVVEKVLQLLDNEAGNGKKLIQFTDFGSTFSVSDTLQALSAPSPLMLADGQAPSCTVEFKNETVFPLYWPNSPLSFSPTASILESLPNITATLGQSAMFIKTKNVPNNATFVSTTQQDYLNISTGGISINMQTGNALVAWDATSHSGLTGPTLLNLTTNILYNRALNTSGKTADVPSIIMANYASIPPTQTVAGTLVDLKWVVFFGAAMAMYPIFFSLYVLREQPRRSSVQAMQLSNGLSDPIGLWLGHLFWDSIFGIIIATIVITILATVSNQFYEFWLFICRDFHCPPFQLLTAH